jgi:hypothetical protein
MPRSRSTLGGLVTVAGTAGLALAGCHSGSATSASASSASASAPGTSGAASAPASSGNGSGATLVGYFPAAIGDTWVYEVTGDGQPGTVTNQVTAVTSVAGGTKVTMKGTEDLSGSPNVSTFTYVIRSDGSISVPTDTLGTTQVKIDSGALVWPGPAQLASGQPTDDTLVTSIDEGGKTTTYTAHAVIKGDGTQTVSVPAGSYSATVVDQVMNEKILGYAVSDDTKTWLANGVGPVKEQTNIGAGPGATGIVEVLKSFTKG